MSAKRADKLREAMPDRSQQGFGADEARWAGLMASAQRGSEGDYRQLLRELSQAVSRYLYSRLGEGDLVDDCVQEVLIAVHQGRHSYDPRRPFRPWLFAIVRHKAMDALRRGRTRQRLYLVGGTAELPEAAVAGPESELGSGQLLNELPANLREALLLTKIEGLSIAEAAQRLAVSKAALKVRVHRAMAKLKKRLESDAV